MTAYGPVAAQIDLRILRHAGFAVQFALQSDGAAVDLTGATAMLTISKSVAAAPAIALTESAGLTLGGTSGTILVELTAAQTASLEVTSYLWDLLITRLGVQPERIAEGAVQVSAGISS